MTSAPALYKALIVRLILFVLPGIGDELNTTVSSGIILICLCVPLAILDKAPSVHLENLYKELIIHV